MKGPCMRRRIACGLLALLVVGGGQTPPERRRGLAGGGLRAQQPAPPAERGGFGEYAGDPVSMAFQNAELRAVLRAFAEISGLNLVIDPQVAGVVDVALVDVPWDQAFDVILRANRLGYEIDGTIVRIAPQAVLAAEAEERRARAERRALAGDLIVSTRALGYARALDLADLITRTVLSPRGQVEVDARTNTLVIADLEARVSAAEALIDQLDRPTPQVQIQARIVQASQDYLRELGVQWDIAGRLAPALGDRAAVTAIAEPASSADADRRTDAGRSSGLAVDLGVSSPSAALGLALGAVGGPLNLDVMLSAAESDGHVKILSNPRITTQNNVEAVITQGDQIPIQTVANNTVTVTFRDAALRLAVTPQITTADTVIMRIDIGNDFADFAREVNGVPPIVTQSASTTVQVANGETTVIGGIYESARTRSDRRVPGIHRVPILGWFFRSRAERRRTDELLIFLTPRIVR